MTAPYGFPQYPIYNHYTGPSADEIANAIVRRQSEAKTLEAIVSHMKDALAQCRRRSAWLKANKDAPIPKAYFAEARFSIDTAGTGRCYRT